MNEVEIKLDSKGRGAVLVNGIDISDLVSGIEVMAFTHDEPTVRLTVRSDRLKVLASVARIEVEPIEVERDPYERFGTKRGVVWAEPSTTVDTPTDNQP